MLDFSNIEEGRVHIVLNKSQHIQMMDIIEEIGFKVEDMKESGDQIYFKLKVRKDSFAKNIRIFKEEKKNRDKKRDNPWSIHQYFLTKFKQKFPSAIVAKNPTQKELAKWKSLIERYDTDNCKIIIDYVFEDFDHLNKKFGWDGVNVNVICGWSDSILAVRNGIGVKENKFNPNDRATSVENYEEHEYNW